MGRYVLFLIFSLVWIAQSEAQSNVTNTWIIKADHINPDNYYGATVANGMIGITSSPLPLQMSHVILSGVYDKYGEGNTSRIMEGFNFATIDLTIDGEVIDEADVSDMSQKLNMKRAVLISHFTIPGKADVTYSVRALRQLPYTSLIVVKIKPQKPITITAGSVIKAPTDLHNIQKSFAKIAQVSLLTSVGKSPKGKRTIAVSSSFIFSGKHPPSVSQVYSGGKKNEMQFTKHLAKDSTYRFAVVSSETSDVHFLYPANEAERLTIYAKLQGLQKLIRNHNEAWNKLWKSRIIVRGNPPDQQDINYALYNLYSYIRKGTAYSISPMGLSSRGYNGHIFWDAEIWMFPSLLVLQPDLARSMLNYRYKRLEAAKQKAKALGYEGAMFPWESASTGQEATPVSALTGPFEQHITADIAIACWNYFRVTHDIQWLKQKGYPIIKNAANFWVSRVETDSSGIYHINNVVGADEYAANINDDAFTNGATKKALIFAVDAARVLGKQPNPKWKEVASHLVIPTFKNGITKEYASYHGQKIKQADVSLLAYPLNIIQNPQQIKRNLNYYEPKIAHGPAMSYSIFGLLWARLGNSAKAYHLFHRGYKPNELPPFGALAETAGGTNPYFATGAGGMLQCVLFGFGGLKITNQGITQIPSVLPDQWKSLTITGVGVHNNTYHVNN